MTVVLIGNQNRIFICKSNRNRNRNILQKYRIFCSEKYRWKYNIILFKRGENPDNHPEMEKQGKEVMEQVESYMKDKYQVSLKEEMTIVNTYDYGKDVETYKLRDAAYAVKYSAAVSVPNRNLIIINMQIVTPEAYRFFLTHELVHKYQAIKAKEELTTINKNVGLPEGMADIIAQDLTSICLESKDKDILRNELATPEDFKKAVKTYGETQSL